MVRARSRSRGDRRGDRLSASFRSFDARNERSAPTRASFVAVDGVEHEITFDQPTLIVAVKADCDGCRNFYDGDLSALAPLRVLIIAGTIRDVSEFSASAHPVYESPTLFEELGIRWPPFYVLIGAAPPRVLAEGIAFSPEQVAEEIAPHRGV